MPFDLSNIKDICVTAAGTVSAPTITVIPSTVTVQHIASVGSLSSLTSAPYTAPAPSDTTKIWVDSANSNVPKVYNGSSWITLGSVWS